MICTYCGDRSNSLDHVVPRAASQAHMKGDRRKKYCVPACIECNNVLNAKLFLTVGSRAAFLSEAYPVRYKKLLKQPEWTESEIDELGYNLRQIVLSSANARSQVRVRIAHCEAVALLSPTISEVWAATDEILGGSGMSFLHLLMFNVGDDGSAITHEVGEIYD